MTEVKPKGTTGGGRDVVLVREAEELAARKSASVAGRFIRDLPVKKISLTVC